MALKIPPPVIFLFTSLLIYLFSDKTLTTQSIVITCTLWFIGFVVALLALIPYFQRKTTIDPRNPQKTSTLITHGIYRISRNPMYLSLILGLTGWTILWQFAWGILMIGLAMLYLTEYQIKPEEQALTAKFGESFTLYQQQVRRWL